MVRKNIRIKNRLHHGIYSLIDEHINNLWTFP